MTFPTGLFPRDRERTLRSFDALDISTGRAVQDFFGGVTVSGSTIINKLSNVEWNSHNVSTGATSDGTSPVARIDKDFDVTFDKSIKVEGDVILTIPTAMQNSTTGSHSMFAQAKIEHVDTSGTATQLGLEISGAVLQSATATTFEIKNNALKIKVPRTTFKSGEILRLNTQVWGWRASGTFVVFLGHDPAGRFTGDFEVFPSPPITPTWDAISPPVLKAQVPIVIEE